MMARFPWHFAILGMLTVLACGVSAQEMDAVRQKEISRWLGEGTYSPTATIQDRKFWSQVAASSTGSSVVADGGKLLSRPIRPLPSELYLEYSKTGNRSRYERVFFGKSTISACWCDGGMRGESGAISAEDPS